MEGVNILQDVTVVSLESENYLNRRKMLSKENIIIDWIIKKLMEQKLLLTISKTQLIVVFKK